MADASTIAGSGLVALAVAAAPKIFELARFAALRIELGAAKRAARDAGNAAKRAVKD